MNDIADFITAQRTTAKPPGADIRQRWQTRIIARGLHQQGQAGADIYMRDYGRGISTAKVVALAMLASAENCPEIAAGFWVAAYRLAKGKTAVPPDSEDSGDTTATSAIVPSRQEFKIPGLPPHLQPGAVITMQPVDTAKTRASYILDPSYLGQPKRDGTRIVVFATAQSVHYQSRSTSILPSPGVEFDRALKAVAQKIGTFVLDGELVYRDAVGGEHRSGSQAAQTNANNDHPQGLVRCCLCVFKALYAQGQDLTTAAETGRILAGENLVTLLQPHLLGAQCIEQVPTAFTAEQKAALCERQHAEGREGEVWVRHDAAYVGGKVGETFVRTKYLEETEVVITALTPTTVIGRRFAAIKVSEAGPDGVLHPVGKVGTGFTNDQDLSVGQRILVRHQGRTEIGMLWHARFISVIE